MFSHTPAFVHARKRLYTLCHGPNRSGRSRHGTPVFSQYSIALSISRLLFPGRPPCGFLSGGNSSLIFFHFSSLISCRLMCPILSLLSALLNTQVLKQALGRHVQEAALRACLEGQTAKPASAWRSPRLGNGQSRSGRGLSLRTDAKRKDSSAILSVAPYY